MLGAKGPHAAGFAMAQPMAGSPVPAPHPPGLPTKQSLVLHTLIKVVVGLDGHGVYVLSRESLHRVRRGAFGRIASH
jgi:hypothetical protein